MKKIFLIILSIMIIILSACGTERKADNAVVFSDSGINSNLDDEESHADDIVSETENKNIHEENFCFDSVFLNSESIRSSDDDSSYALIGSLHEIIDFKDKVSGAPALKCAVIKFVPREYSFVFIKQSGDVYPGGYYHGGYAVLISDITEIVSAYNGCDVQQANSVKIKQYIELTPSEEYMNYFIKRYGNENEGIKSIPDGIYEFEKDKLIEMGISGICSKGSPILEYNKEYYAFVVEEDDGAVLSDATAYCDADLEPVEIKINNSGYAWEYKQWSNELIEIIKELKK